MALTGIILIIYSDTTFRSDGMLGAVLVVMTTIGASAFKVLVPIKIRSLVKRLAILRQEAQLPQRNSASAAHMEGAKPSSPLPLPSGYTYATVQSENRNKRTPSVPSVKRT